MSARDEVLALRSRMGQAIVGQRGLLANGNLLGQLRFCLASCWRRMTGRTRGTGASSIYG